MQFRVPQFIDIEDKILGPLTWKQSAYCLGAIGVVYLAFRFTDSTIIALLFAIPFGAFFLCLAFFKMNNQNFVDILENAFKYYSKNNLYTWNKDYKKEELSSTGESDNINVIKKVNQRLVATTDINKLNNKKNINLRDLAVGLDTDVTKNSNTEDSIIPSK
jgi:hypothetical protein